MSHENNQSRAFHQFDVGFNIIIDLITPGTRVLDLGCGSGTLLARLRDEKDIEGCGVELDEDKVIKCIERGIRVMTLDIDEGLGGFPDLSYEYVVLSRTLQQLMYPDKVIKEMLRVGSKSIITFPNFGQWKTTLKYMLTGRTPVSETYPLPWFSSPDIHRITIKDFRDFMIQMDAKIEKEIFMIGNVPRTDAFLADRRSEWGCFLVSRA